MGGTLRLSTGRYLMTALDLEPGSTVVLTSASGPVEIFVRSSVIYRGQFTDVTGRPENLRITYLGTAAVALEASYRGRFTAPNAALTIGATGGTNQTFVGLFFANSIDVRPDVRVGCQATLAEGSALGVRIGDTASGGGGGCSCTTAAGSGGRAGQGELGGLALSGLALVVLRRRRQARSRWGGRD